MTKKIATLLVLAAGLTLVEVIMVFFARTKGPMPFKIKLQPEWGFDQ